MPRWVKWGLIALAAWAVFTQPTNAANAAGKVLSGFGHAGTSAVTFLSALFS